MFTTELLHEEEGFSTRVQSSCLKSSMHDRLSLDKMKNSGTGTNKNPIKSKGTLHQETNRQSTLH